jgi:hypothetical protein
MAALRPRNDTKLQQFCLKTNGFGQMQAFLRKINVPLLHEPRNDTETVGFPWKTYGTSE